MTVEPLEQLFESIGKRPFMPENSSACWRGYVGRWKVKNDKLFLSRLMLSFENPEVYAHIMRGEKELFASWFSGIIRIPSADYPRFYDEAEQTVLTFKNGDLIQIKGPEKTE